MTAKIEDVDPKVFLRAVQFRYTHSYFVPGPNPYGSNEPQPGGVETDLNDANQETRNNQTRTHLKRNRMSRRVRHPK